MILKVPCLVGKTEAVTRLTTILLSKFGTSADPAVTSAVVIALLEVHHANENGETCQFCLSRVVHNQLHIEDDSTMIRLRSILFSDLIIP
jgi:hypothetical protein